jgi:hypothetical protein
VNHLGTSGFVRLGVEIRGWRFVKKSELLKAIQGEIQRHNLSTFMSEKHKIVQTGCSTCQKHFGTVEQFKRHITEGVRRRCWIDSRERHLNVL